jgi:hypothetical protein
MMSLGTSRWPPQIVIRYQAYAMADPEQLTTVAYATPL